MSFSPKRKTPILVLLMLALAGCYDDRNAQNSLIIRLLEANGAGNLSTYTKPGLEQWFGATKERQDLARKIAAMCDPISKTSTADWAITAEGTACAAAVRTRAFSYRPGDIKADPRAW